MGKSKTTRKKERPPRPHWKKAKSEKPEIYDKPFWQFGEDDREQFFLDSRELVHGKYSIEDLPMLNRIVALNSLKPKLELKTLYQLLNDMWKEEAPKCKVRANSR